MYSPRARRPAAAFRFPYPDASFDLVFAGSVFTHLFDADLARYASETARVLKPGGRCVATFYLLDARRRAATAEGRAAFRFAHPHAGAWVEFPDLPEAAVAHDQLRVLGHFAQAGLVPAEPPRYGVWDRSADQDQDFLVLRAVDPA